MEHAQYNFGGKYLYCSDCDKTQLSVRAQKTWNIHTCTILRKGTVTAREHMYIVLTDFGIARRPQIAVSLDSRRLASLLTLQQAVPLLLLAVVLVNEAQTRMADLAARSKSGQQAECSMLRCCCLFYWVSTLYLVVVPMQRYFTFAAFLSTLGLVRASGCCYVKHLVVWSPLLCVIARVLLSVSVDFQYIYLVFLALYLYYYCISIDSSCDFLQSICYPVYYIYIRTKPSRLFSTRHGAE